jgi:hypothetical protein
MDSSIKANIIAHMLENGRYRCKTREDAKIAMASMSKHELLDIYLSEIGIIGYTTQILQAVNEIQMYTERMKSS